MLEQIAKNARELGLHVSECWKNVFLSNGTVERGGHIHEVYVPARRLVCIEIVMLSNSPQEWKAAAELLGISNMHLYQRVDDKGNVIMMVYTNPFG